MQFYKCIHKDIYKQSLRLEQLNSIHNFSIFFQIF
jgi:L-rhamnose mutarotase